MQILQDNRPKLFIGIDIHKRSWKIQTATDMFSGKGFCQQPKAIVLKRYIDKTTQATRFIVPMRRVVVVTLLIGRLNPMAGNH